MRIYEDLRVVQSRLARAAEHSWSSLVGALVVLTSGTCRWCAARYFRDLAENNRIRAVPHRRAARGRSLDRNGPRARRRTGLLQRGR